MLAILFEMTWTLSSWAIIPVAAVASARIPRSPQSFRLSMIVLRDRFAVFEACSRRNFRELLDGIALQLVLLMNDVGDLGVGARELDHARHLDHRAHVRFLDRALLDVHVDRRLRQYAVRRPERAGAVFDQLLGIGERNEPQPAPRRVGV